MAKFSTLSYTDETIIEMRQKANFCDFNTQTTDYTLVSGDWGKWLKVNSSSDVDITVPLDAFPVGGAIPIIRMGVGEVTVVPAEGVTINSDGEDNAIPSQYKTALLIQVSSNTWLLQGIGATGSSSGGGGGEDPLQLSTPNLTMSSASGSTMDFSWSNVANESSYSVQIATNSGFTTGVQTATPAADDTTHQFTGLTASTVYYGRVKAVGDGTTYTDSNYGSDSSLTAGATSGDVLHDSQFTGTNGANVIGGYTPDVGVPWTLVDGDGYEIQSNKADAQFDGANLSRMITTVTEQSYRLTATLSRDNYDVHFYLRATNVNNALRISMSGTHTTIHDMVSGVPTIVGSTVAEGLGTSTEKVVEITLTDSTHITIYIDATLVFSGQVIPTNNTGTKLAVGMGLGQFNRIKADMP
jgi:hypothetical protein